MVRIGKNKTFLKIRLLTVKGWLAFPNACVAIPLARENELARCSARIFRLGLY